MQIIILAHGKAQAVFDQHLPLWKKHGLPIVVFSPTDDQVDPRGLSHLNFGTSSKNGPCTVERMRYVIEFVSRSKFDVSVIFEYDSICLKAELTPRSGLHGIVHENKDPVRFMTMRYALAPWMLDRESANKMLAVARTYPDVQEEGCHDRLLSAWAALAGVPILPHPERGFAENTILAPFLDVPGIEGSQWIHGIKYQACLDFILSRWKS